jgi:hypothetical protein
MDSWQYAGLAYGVVGILYMLVEHRCFEFDFSQATKGQMLLVALQQSIHYLRVAVAWPTYLVEDFLICLSNREDV